MCGVIGSFEKSRHSPWVSNEIHHLSHRGPDSQSVISVSEHITLGSTRLAMTDPHPRSNQPMVDKQTQNHISFNGEIYNFRELRNELEQEGILFDTDSDTEVLLKGLTHKGINFLSKANGMYAFAFFNKSEKSIIIARDWLGKKPLYYLKNDAGFYWSSSLVPLRKISNSLRIDEDGLSVYLALGYTIDPQTIMEKISSVRPGTYIHITALDETIVEMDLPSFKQGKDFVSDNLRENINTAIQRRIDGHGSVAISLSGGIDSSIVAMGARHGDAKVTAYSARWVDSDKSRYNNDADAAKLIATNLGINFVDVDIFQASDLRYWLDLYTKEMEEPNSNPTGLTMSYLYKKIAQDGHRLLLTGDGADEILAGYPRYQSISKMPNILNIPEYLVSKLLYGKRTNLNSKLIYLLNSQVSMKSPGKWLHWHWIYSPSEIQDLTKNVNVKKNLHKLVANEMEFADFKVIKKSVASQMNLDLRIWLSMESNRKLDRISMANSIEARSPFQDENVIATARKLMESSSYGTLNKKFLWDAYPEMTGLGVRRDKVGFISPVGHWLRANPGLVSENLEFLREYSFFKNLDVLKMRNIPKNGQFDELKKLWSLIVLASWLRNNRHG